MASPARPDAPSVLVVANRLPMSLKKEKNGEWTYKMSSGGLVSALMGVKGLKMKWIGWPGAEIAAADQPIIREQILKKNCVPVFLSEKIADLYYTGFSNNVLWPLLHYLPLPIEDTVNTATEQWEAYKVANQKFCDAVLSLYKPGDVVFVNDYHLMLLPAMLKKAHPNMKLGFFLHTPFPSSEIYRLLPWREEILKGVLCCDLIGFHTYDYARHFKTSCAKLLGVEVNPEGVDDNGHFAMVGTFPIGIDPQPFLTALESSEEVQKHIIELKKKFDGRRVMLGVDRLDIIKGIPHKILAMEQFLEENPAWIGRVVLVQIAVPSRYDVPEYKRLMTLTHELVGRVNGKFGTVDSVPIHYLDQSIPFPILTALYRVSDVCIVSSVRDGMNLVSYEYITCQQGNDGVLILSEFAGAAQSLGAGSIRVNPWDTAQLADAIKYALDMSPEERQIYHKFAFHHVTTYTAQHWADSFVSRLAQCNGKAPGLLKPPMPTPPQSSPRTISPIMPLSQFFSPSPVPSPSPTSTSSSPASGSSSAPAKPQGSLSKTQIMHDDSDKDEQKLQQPQPVKQVATPASPQKQH